MATVAVLVVVGSVPAASGLPTQVSVQVTQKKSEMAMSWVTEEETRTSKVQFGTSRTALGEEAWSAVQWQYNFKNSYVSGFIHKVILRDLMPGVRYYYRVGDDDDGWSPVYWFKTRQNSYDSTVRLATLADQDMTEDSVAVLNGLLREQVNFQYDMLLHAGDIVYADGEQGKWDQYAEWWSPFAAYYPVSYAVGDQDVEGQATLAYNSRFRHSLKPDSEDEDWGPNWYSFDYGPVHVIFLSSEHSKYENDIAQQAHWLEQNLQKANRAQQRLKVPWIVVVLHRPLHNNPPAGGYAGGISSSMRKKFEAHFKKYRVNVVLHGHCHNYERTFPMYDETIMQYSRGWESTPYYMPVYEPPTEAAIADWGMIYTTVGTAGRPVEPLRRFPTEYERPCVVKHTNGVVGGAFIERERDCSSGCFSKDWSAYMNSERGFGVLEANRSALHFKFFSVESDEVIDDFVVCAVRDCKPAPPVEREWDDRSEAERGAVDEQHIAPPPAPPMPPLSLLPVDSLQPSSVYYGPGQSQYAPSSRDALDNFIAASTPAANSKQEPLPAAGDAVPSGGPGPASAASGGGTSSGLVAGIVVLCIAIIMGVAGGVGVAIVRQRRLGAAASEEQGPRFELNPHHVPAPVGTLAGGKSPLQPGASMRLPLPASAVTGGSAASLQLSSRADYSPKLVM
eukprot:jgi/Tetstr1/427701/TSEL_017826.t1